MLLFQKRFQEGIVKGVVTLTFRQWEKPRVKPGGRYRVHPIGVVQVDSIQKVQVRHITEEDARLAGFATLDEMLGYMRVVAKAALEASTEVFRVAFHHGGDGDRVPLALDDQLSKEALEQLQQRLDRLDKEGPWTRKVLQLIAKHPRVAASQLAKKLGRETQPFKADVRKLKKLGLTQSFEVGYEVSPRGKVLLASRRQNAGR